MEFSAATLEHLQDEAYASLCREAVAEQLEVLQRERSAIEDTRPPFGGVLARKESREAFARSMQTSQENEAALQQRLIRIDAIADWLRPLIRNSVSSYLAAVSPSYCALLQASARLDDWEFAVAALPELLLAFARDVRGVRTAASAPGATSAGCRNELAVLREIALRLDRLAGELSLLEQSIATLVGPASTHEVQLPALPDLRRLAWIGRLALLPLPQLIAEVTQVEAEIRQFIATGYASLPGRLQVARDACAHLAENALEQYWDQLRAHARLHYVEERDVDELIDMLTQRYVDADLKRRQAGLTNHPFQIERSG